MARLNIADNDNNIDITKSAIEFEEKAEETIRTQKEASTSQYLREECYQQQNEEFADFQDDLEVKVNAL